MSYYCHDCGTVIEEDVETLCGHCQKKRTTPMTDKKYTLTEELFERIVGELIAVQSGLLHEEWFTNPSTLTPDPSPSGEVVERIVETWHRYEHDLEQACPGEQDDVVSIRVRLAPIIEAEVQRRMEERWIPVTERLPEEMTEVLATGHEWDDKVSGKRFYLVVRFNNSNFHQWVCDDSEDGGYWPESDNVYVTHWQPLPESPQRSKA